MSHTLYKDISPCIWGQFGMQGHFWCPQIQIDRNPSELPKTSLRLYETGFLMSSFSQYCFNTIVQRCVVWQAAFYKHKPKMFVTKYNGKNGIQFTSTSLPISCDVAIPLFHSLIWFGAKDPAIKNFVVFGKQHMSWMWEIVSQFSFVPDYLYHRQFSFAPDYLYHLSALSSKLLTFVILGT